MEDPEEKPGVDLSNIEGINNLDTARMALRWALERLGSLQKVNAELKKKADWELKMRLKDEEHFKSQLELEKTHAEEVAAEKSAQLEKRYSARISEWERDYQDLREKVLREEKLLAEREAEFERFCRAQKAEASKPPQPSASPEASRELQSLIATLTAERADLSRELSDWRRKCQEDLPVMAELEGRAAKAEARARGEAERVRELEELREAERELLRKREEELAALSRKVAAEYRRQREKLEELKNQARQEIAGLVRLHRRKGKGKAE